MKVTQPRKSHTIMNSGAEMSCINIEKAIDAKTHRFKPKQINLTNFKLTRARDESMLKTDDRWYNTQLENTKEEREIEQKARSIHYRNQPINFNK